VICLCHDIERGQGHRDLDPPFATFADAHAPRSLEEILAVEREFGIRGTYHILGCFFGEVREPIAQAGHAIGFHSYDHGLTEPQVDRCRALSTSVKGYRPPQSRLTPELRDENLASLGFEWIASSVRSLGTGVPVLGNGVVRIPIHFDDYPLYARGMPYEEWEEAALHTITQSKFVCFSLHDCYAPSWLPHYRQFLRKITSLGTLATLDDVCPGVKLVAANRHV
jgi:hypothetical protein